MERMRAIGKNPAGGVAESKVGSPHPHSPWSGGVSITPGGEQGPRAVDLMHTLQPWPPAPPNVPASEMRPFRRYAIVIYNEDRKRENPSCGEVTETCGERGLPSAKM